MDLLNHLHTYFNNLLNWVITQLSSTETLVQLLILVLALILVKIITKRYSSSLKKSLHKLDPTGQNLISNVIIELLFPLLTIIFLWIGSILSLILFLPDKIIVTGLYLFSAWVIISVISKIIKNKFLARLFAGFIWIIVALKILGAYNQAVEILTSFSFNSGNLHISLLTVIKGSILLIAFIWLAQKLALFFEYQVDKQPNLTASARVLLSKIIRISLYSIAILITLSSLGIDLTAFAVLGGTIGVGLGFGLQKVVSNFVSGIIILLDKSIKPGDVIETGNVYGWIKSLGSRFVSVVTREGKEYLIPNENFITQQVVNWSYSDNLVRIKTQVGISYKSDVEKAMTLVKQAAEKNSRILDEPEPVCLLKDFGNSSVNLELRFWIQDPREGIDNIKSTVLLNIWKLFHENDIEIPYSQHDLHIKTMPENNQEEINKYFLREVQQNLAASNQDSEDNP